MRKMFFMLVAATMCLPSAAAGKNLDAVHSEFAEGVMIEAAAQEEYDRWVSEREALSAEMRDLKALGAWLEYRIQKYERYLLRQEDVIAELERRKLEARRIETELEPFLETVVDELAEFVARDLPFLEKERRERIIFLKSSLDDYHLGLSEKLRRVFEALQVEAEYGRSVSVESEVVVMGGEPVRGEVFRLGRTALFFQGPDDLAGVWDRESGAWKAVGGDFPRTVRTASGMAEKKRVVELLDLPVGGRR